MSHTYRQTVTDDMAALIEVKRGPLTVQEFTTLALMQACTSCACCATLEAEIERLHTTLRAMQSAPTAEPAKEFELTF